MIRKVVVFDPADLVDWTAGKQVWTSFDNVVGDMNLQVGDQVLALEVDSGVSYPAFVENIHSQLQLIFLKIEWSEAKDLSFE